MPGRGCCQPGPGQYRRRRGWREEPGGLGAHCFQAWMKETSALGREGQEGCLE